jgi:glycosyltransferase involved in cell wall biosynthesis
VVRAERGRGRQLRAGVAASRGEWLLLLHADARLSPAALREAELAMERREVQYAAWPLRIDGTDPWLRWIERGAALRWRLLGLAYGDQGLLLRRSLYETAGGFPDTPIMEDVELIRRLRRQAPMHRFRHPILADGRRWRREGAVRSSVRNVTLLLLHLGGVPAGRLARWYRPEPRR